MSTLSSIEHIEATPGVIGGKPRIKGTRIGVHDVKIWHLEQGESIEQICADYGLSPAQVYAALAFYYDHRAQIEKRLADDETYAEKVMSENPSVLQQKLREREGG